MKKEETDLLKRCGTENPFTVPEGYFANFTEQLMDKLPEREIQPAPQLTLWARVKPWVYMAAMFCGLMLSVRMFVGEKETQSPAAGTMGDMEFSEVPDEYIDPGPARRSPSHLPRHTGRRRGTENLTLRS